ncbi:UDP-glycosyltransferase 88F4-like [Oryza brachyantha]|uniref:Glycosyltransferase n=1 Tax=Oryza brachyantha TaxID=4533 RepID=J3L3T7_ORYBR|nr:UDP-glycosyltransferase 88F4-like [Oryza brachyantha]
MRSSVVLYTWMVRGHIHPMTQLADHIANHGVPVTVAVADVPSSGESRKTVARLSAYYPSVSFQLLPSAPARPGDTVDPDADPFITLLTDIRAANAALIAFVRSLPSVVALVIDFFCADGLDVAAELGVPAYLFFVSCASALASYLHIPVMRSAVSFREMGRSMLRFPGVHPIPASDLPEVLLDRDKEQYKATISFFEQLAKAKHILVNTFEWLEPRAVKAIQDGIPRPGEPAPRLFCVGPLVGEERGGEEKKHECLRWLDVQPARSVVFLCFGSASSLPAEQLKEIAVGLERSNHSFLWAVRAPVTPDADSTKRLEGRGEAALESLLPEGFLDRTRGRGLVLSSWAPQVQVLRHPATGAFVTHCGWNSTLEAVTAGVPMVCWPMYAEQRMNKVFIVEDMKLGVVIDGYDDGMVKAEEVQAKVRLVMESEQGKQMRERMALAKEMATRATQTGGSSMASFADFLGSRKIDLVNTKTQSLS